MISRSLLSISILALFILFSACNNNQTGEQAPAQTEQKTPPPPAAKQYKEYYPSLPLETAQALFKDCDFIDYLFYSLPLSMSFNEEAAIHSVVRHISASPAPVRADCKSIGRISYQQDGEYLLEADMYMTGDCTYFVFLKDNKPTYGNLMTEEGVRFYQNTIKQAMSQGQGQ